jgi:hypothetical protein
MRIPKRDVGGWLNEIIGRCTASRTKRLMRGAMYRNVYLTGAPGCGLGGRKHLVESLLRCRLGNLTRLLNKSRGLEPGILRHIGHQLVQVSRDFEDFGVLLRPHRDGADSLVDQLPGGLDFLHSRRDIARLSLWPKGWSGIRLCLR